MTILVEFIEQGGPTSFRPWPKASGAPAVGDTVDIQPTYGVSADDEVVAHVQRREWHRAGKAVVCYVSTR
jgi:hypothetical protein